ncbi:RimK family alpha-L-glutamate ligase [Streptomyces sp. NPDC021224]|uniref:ATP-grasp domain-containing protein n=1 Tax=unclassified Streptomyces TaxID=2593676 RepID=UPI003792C6D8
MQIGILGWDREETESVGLLEAGTRRGHDVTLFTLDDIVLAHTATGPQAYVQGGPAARFDVVMSRAELRSASFRADHERYALLCETPGITVIDPAATYVATEHKLQSMARLGAAGLPIAPTRSCASRADVAEALAQWGPVVLKPTFGYGGTDVERVYGLESDGGTVDRLLADHGVLMCQPYLPHPEGDVRITLVGDEAVLNCRRVPPGGDRWRANVMQGARSVDFDAPEEMLEVARRAARVMGLTVAALDFLPAPGGDGFLIIEINNTPGWYFVPQERQERIAESVYRLVEARMRGTSTHEDPMRDVLTPAEHVRADRARLEAGSLHG